MIESPNTVMPGLEPGIQGPEARSPWPWIAGSSPAMTVSIGETLMIVAQSTAVMPGQRAGHPVLRASNGIAGGMDCRVKPGNDGTVETLES